MSNNFCFTEYADEENKSIYCNRQYFVIGMYCGNRICWVSGYLSIGRKTGQAGKSCYSGRQSIL